MMAKGFEATKCTCCGKTAEVLYIGYTGNDSRLALCTFDALQLARKILEDLCEAAGDRHG